MVVRIRVKDPRKRYAVAVHSRLDTGHHDQSNLMYNWNDLKEIATLTVFLFLTPIVLLSTGLWAIFTIVEAILG